MIDNETPTQAQAREQLRRIAYGLATTVQSYLPPDVKIGFAVVVFDIGVPGAIAYASNGQRDDMVKALRELTEKVLIEGEAADLSARSS